MSISIIPPGPIPGAYAKVKIDEAEVVVWLTPSELADLYLALTAYYADTAKKSS